jgi:LPXTG-motif cell wall-anchored protein
VLPGNYVEVLFQVSGISANCDNGAAVRLVYDYPFSLDEGTDTRKIDSSTYAGDDINSYWNVLYKLRVDENALEGDHTVELRYHEGKDSSWDDYAFEKFTIEIEGARTDFEVHVDNYKIADRTLTFQILNTGDQDIEALTVEIPKQDSIVVKGSNRNIVGDLDSSEYTTADFEAFPTEGNILLNLHYTDSIGERRTIEKIVNYDPNYFLDSLENTGPSKTGTYVTIGLIIIVAGYLIYRRRKNKKNKMKSKKQFSI